MDSRASISSAIARSRKARRALQSRKRRLAFAAGAVLLAAVPLSFSLVGVTGNDLVHAAVSEAKSLSDLLNQRSPGERTAALLTKTKQARALARQRFSAVAPPDRFAAAPPVIRRKDFGEVAGLVIGPPTIDVAPPIAESAIYAPTLPSIIGGGSGGGSGSGPVVGGGGTGGGGGPASLPASEPHSPVPVTALPEPRTWATMLLGFALLGWRIRRRPQHVGKKASA